MSEPTSIDDPITATVTEVVTKLLRPKPSTPPAPDLHLFGAKLIDSFGLLELVGALETRFAIALATEDLTIQNFTSIHTIAALVRRYQHAA